MDQQHDLFLRWLSDSQDALEKLKSNVQRVRWQQEACCDVYGAASRVVMSLEQSVLLKLLDDHRSAALPEIFAATASNIELAQLLVEVMQDLLAACTLHTLQPLPNP